MRIPVYLRYILASAVALGVDFSLFLCGLRFEATPAAAAAFGYTAGIAAHWLFSSRLVFEEQIAATPRARIHQQALFVLSAFAGLGITLAIVSGGSHFGYDARLSKIIAIGVSFQATYLLRRKIVFPGDLGVEVTISGDR